MKDLVLFDLFSGIGGFAKGFTDAGFTFKKHYFSEINPHSIANYRYNFQHAQHIGSIESFSPGKIERANLVTFGFPCQDISLAGHGKGLSGKRSGLFFQAMRIIEYFRPEVFVFENVKNLFSSNEGEDFETVLRTIANLGIYECEWQLLNTSWLLPQNRERIYFVGHLRGRSIPGVFPLPIGHKTIGNNNERNKSSAIYFDNSIPNAVTRRGRVMEISGALMATPRGAIAIKKNDEIQFRNFTEVEQERLQGFPDNWTKYGLYNSKGGGLIKKEVSSAQRYKQCGNAVTVSIVKEVASRIKIIN